MWKIIQAIYFETFCGNDYFRDKHGNIYTKVGNEIAFCSNLKQGILTENKAEPSFTVEDIELVYNKVVSTWTDIIDTADGETHLKDLMCILLGY